MRKPAYVLALVVVSMVLPLSIYAAHQFEDVPASSTFHNAIDWMAETGITVGCNPPDNDRYCPSEPVTRGQMSAFMKRLAEFQVVDAGTLGGKSPAALGNPVVNARNADVDFVVGGVVKLAQLTIATPANGGLVIDGAVTFEGQDALSMVWIQVDATACNLSPASIEQVMFGLFEQTNGAAVTESITGAAVVSSGQHTVTFCGFAGGATPATALAVSLVAEYATSVTKTGALMASGADNVLEMLGE